ncbi:hypothetical protein KDA_18320 [Dictyobacter alpinus]|uniref:Uncharacterized protein n=1 Tax=Dictyobacter alpinus TaxID=2014873 RepID=A0A402B4S8_9CHLR|nr:hypothetical protein [Dictyobacter alpinus]GCE26348.1 hypothetical protein KDA_18320 [Dictyobacter alpinus]
MTDGKSSQETRQEQIKRLRQQYGEFYKSFIKILASYDPLGLVSSGAPDNEYDIEVDAVLLRMKEAKSVDMLSTIIYEEFVRCFSLPPTHPKAPYNTIAASVWDTYQRWLQEQS